MADYFHAGDFLDFLVGVEGDCEKQFIVFSPVHCCRDEVHVKLLCHQGGLVVDGDAVFVYAAPHIGGFADVEEF